MRTTPLVSDPRRIKRLKTTDQILSAKATEVLAGKTIAQVIVQQASDMNRGRAFEGLMLLIFEDGTELELTKQKREVFFDVYRISTQAPVDW